MKIFKFEQISGNPVEISFQYNWDYIETISEFKKMNKTEQNPKWHSEGNVMRHTRTVCKYMLYFLDNKKNKNIDDYSENTIIKFDIEKWIDNLILLISALFHDIGKPKTTKLGKDRQWHSYGHEFEGEKITKQILEKELDCNNYIDKTLYSHVSDICSLIKYHMLPFNIFKEKHPIEKILKVSREIPSWEMLILLKECDDNGSIQASEKLTENEKFKNSKTLQELREITKSLDCFNKPANDVVYKYLNY